MKKPRTTAAEILDDLIPGAAPAEPEPEAEAPLQIIEPPPAPGIYAVEIEDYVPEVLPPDPNQAEVVIVSEPTRPALSASHLERLKAEQEAGRAALAKRGA